VYVHQIKIKRVCAARRHSVVVDAEGRAYSFGSGEDGKLGHGNELDQLLPKQIAALQGHKIVDASCGESLHAPLIHGSCCGISSAHGAWRHVHVQAYITRCW
jgi:hypothetical protein